jgi:hypothetical protein
LLLISVIAPQVTDYVRSQRYKASTTKRIKTKEGVQQ